MDSFFAFSGVESSFGFLSGGLNGSFSCSLCSGLGRSCGLSHFLSGRPMSIDKKSGRLVVVVLRMLGGSGMLVLSSPAGNLSPVLGGELKSALGSVGSLKADVILMDRSVSFVCSCYSGYYVVFGRGVDGPIGVGGFFSGGLFFLPGRVGSDECMM